MILYRNFFVMDGQTFTVEYKLGDRTKRIYYDNPESYLEEFPEVDELVYFNQFIELIRSEFSLEDY